MTAALEQSTPPPRPRYKRWLLLAGLVVIVLCVILAIQTAPPAAANAIQITFLGYTNAPGDNSKWRFAQFSVSNQAPYTIRWRGGGTQIEGRPGYQAQVINRNLPAYTFYEGRITGTNQPGNRSLTLKPRESLVLTIGEPSADNHGPANRWRHSMIFTRYTLPQRYYDLVFFHHWPIKLGHSC